MYPEDAGFCPIDGVGLLPAREVPPAPRHDEPRIGKILRGRYQIRRSVADGGMGRVYEALDLEVDARVAVKILHHEVAGDEVAVERFKREFEVSKLLPHAHIVDVKDFTQTDDNSFALVMEFLDGEELRMLLKREKFVPPERLIPMLSQVAIGLDEAHKRELVHRDLKPDNIFLCGSHDRDIVKVLDFGSVKDKSSMAKKLTVVGTTIGSPFYMAPEQAQGLETLDARADVWSLAAICYECITGTVPFKGTSGPSILLAILTKDHEPPTLVGASAATPIPPAMDEVMELALAKNAAIRTQSVGAFVDEVGRAYGLTGDHRQWALASHASLRVSIEEARPKVMAARVAAVDALSDPFAADPAPVPAAAGLAAMDRAFSRADAEASSVEAVAGLPRSGMPWLVPALVGLFLVLAGIVGAAVLLR